MQDISNFISIMGMDFVQISFDIHNNTCKLIHKECHQKNYHIDIMYHMMLGIILSADLKSPTSFLKYLKKFFLDPTEK